MTRAKQKFSFDTNKQMKEKIAALAAEFKRLARFLPCIYYVITVISFIVFFLKLRHGGIAEEITVEKKVVRYKTTELDEDFRRKLQGYFDFREARSFPNCESLIKEDAWELERVQQLKTSTKIDSLSFPNGAISTFIQETSCQEYFKIRNYPNLNSPQRTDFPLAYSMVVHKNPGQVERLLRAIYSPENVYCIHIDAKSPFDVYSDLEELASCFPNVFLARKRESVLWGSYERFQADLNCMEELLEHKIQWRYLINVCGEDFPLKTNSEIVDHLRSIYPQNSITSETMPKKKLKRYQRHWRIKRNFFREYKFIPKPTIWRKSPPPIDIEIYAGSAYNMVTREFVNWMMKDEEVKELIEWSRDAFSPDEFIWASIAWMERAPGHEFQMTNTTNELSRLILWTNAKSPPHHCQGYTRRGVCVFGSGDLAWVTNRPHMFANKFDDHDDFAIQCLEEELRRRTNDHENQLKLEKKTSDIV